MFNKIFCFNGRIKTFFLAALLMLLPLSVFSEDLDQYIPSSGVIYGEMMILAASPELEAIAQKMQIAVAAKPEWFMSYVEQSGPGALPYHENFGISEEEYLMILSLADDGGLKLQNVGSVKIILEKNDAEGFTFHVDPADFPLHKLSISADQQYVETSYGHMKRVENTNQSDVNASTGRWSGIKWEQEDELQNVALRAELHIGKRHDYDDGILYYKVTYLSEHDSQKMQFVVLYPLE